MRRVGLPATALAAAALVVWVVARHVPAGLMASRHRARVRGAEAALAGGHLDRGLDLLAQAGSPGEERLGRLLVSRHSAREWDSLVLAVSGSRRPVRRAISRVLQRSPEERLCTLELLAALDDPQATQGLGTALIAPSPSAHDPASLSSLGHSGVAALANVARSTHGEAQARAVRLLGESPSRSAAQALLTLARRPDYPARATALRAACVNHLGVVRPHFPAFLADPDPVLRAEAVTQFGFADGAAASRALERALRDADRRVRRAAVEAAANVSAPETASLLIQALEDDDATVVRRAVCALGARGCRDAEQALTRLYARSDRDLQCDIAQALCWMDSRLGPEYKAQWERETGRPLIVSSEWDG